MSKIEWTEKTWNVVTGCTKITAGCAHCYAERMSKRLQAMGQPNYVNGFKVTTHEHMLLVPLERKKPTMYFVCSMSDLFHQDVPFDFIQRVFDIMRQADWHTFQVLTKRPERMLEFSRTIQWPANVWAGTTVESIHVATHRIEALNQIQAPIRFLSCEPLLGPLGKADFSMIHWVIVGGESGPGARPMNISSALEIKSKARAHGIAFFMKQITDDRGRKIPMENWPEELRVREMPHVE